MITLTTSHKRVLAAIHSLAPRGYGPSHKEIAAEAGFKSARLISRYLNDLRALGLIEHSDGRHRSVGVCCGGVAAEQELRPRPQDDLAAWNRLGSRAAA